MNLTSDQQRHQPPAIRQRIIATLAIVAVILCVFGFFAWRLYFVYTEYQLGSGIVSGNAATSKSALHTLAIMRGIGLIFLGVVHLAIMAVHYFHEPSDKRKWTTRDTIEGVIGLVFIGCGTFLFYNDQAAIVGLR